MNEVVESTFITTIAIVGVLALWYVGLRITVHMMQRQLDRNKFAHKHPLEEYESLLKRIREIEEKMKAG